LRGEYETDERIVNGLLEIMSQGKVSYYTKPKLKVPTYGQFLEELYKQRKASVAIRWTLERMWEKMSMKAS